MKFLNKLRFKLQLFFVPRHHLADGYRRRVKSGKRYIIQGANMSKKNNRVLSRKVAQIWGTNGYFFLTFKLTYDVKYYVHYSHLYSSGRRPPRKEKS